MPVLNPNRFKKVESIETITYQNEYNNIMFVARTTDRAAVLYIYIYIKSSTSCSCQIKINVALDKICLFFFFFKGRSVASRWV